MGGCQGEWRAWGGSLSLNIQLALSWIREVGKLMGRAGEEHNLSESLWLSQVVGLISALTVPAAGWRIRMGSNCWLLLYRCHKMHLSNLFNPPVLLFQMGITEQDSVKSAAALLNRKELQQPFIILSFQVWFTCYTLIRNLCSFTGLGIFMSSSGMSVVYKMFYDYFTSKAGIKLGFLIKKILYRDGVCVSKFLPSCAWKKAKMQAISLAVC